MNDYGYKKDAVYLYQVTSVDDFEEYYMIKVDKTAILWSGFSIAPNREKLRVHFEKIIHDRDIYLYYLKDSKTHEVIGYDQMKKLDKDTVESSGHSIKSEYQRRGFGNLLLELLVEKARELCFKKIVGWISENNIGSVKNFENAGFRKSDRPFRIVRLEAFGREDHFYMYENVL